MAFHLHVSVEGTTHVECDERAEVIARQFFAGQEVSRVSATARPMISAGDGTILRFEVDYVFGIAVPRLDGPRDLRQPRRLG